MKWDLEWPKSSKTNLFSSIPPHILACTTVPSLFYRWFSHVRAVAGQLWPESGRVLVTGLSLSRRREGGKRSPGPSGIATVRCASAPPRNESAQRSGFATGKAGKAQRDSEVAGWESTPIDHASCPKALVGQRVDSRKKHAGMTGGVWPEHTHRELSTDFEWPGD